MTVAESDSGTKGFSMLACSNVVFTTVRTWSYPGIQVSIAQKEWTGPRTFWLFESPCAELAATLATACLTDRSSALLMAICRNK